MLTASTIAIGAPITYDLTTGAVGAFELLKWVLLAAVLLASGRGDVRRAAGAIRPCLTTGGGVILQARVR